MGQGNRHLMQVGESMQEGTSWPKQQQQNQENNPKLPQTNFQYFTIIWERDPRKFAVYNKTDLFQKTQSCNQMVCIIFILCFHLT